MQQPPQNPYQPQSIYPANPSQEQASYIPMQQQQMAAPQPLTQQQMAEPQPLTQQQMYEFQPSAPQQQPYPYGQAAPMPPQQPYPSAYPQQQMLQQPPMPQVMQSNVNINISNGKQRGLLSRTIYFLFIGWWLGFIWLNIGYFCVLTVVLLPLGLVMLNRLPQVMTLRPPSATSTNVNVSTTMVAGGVGGPVMMQNVNVNVGSIQQHNFLLRALYFCCIGWWAGYFWACLGYSLVCLIVTLPLGLMMLNRLPAVLTLRKN